MRRLLLLRHAKAERAEPGARDIARPLSERGRHDAALIGVYIARHALTPDRALVSPAARTQDTWKLLSADWRTAPPMQSEKPIYDAAAGTLLDLIKGMPRTVERLLVIGHNPGLHDFAVGLLASGEVEPRERLREKLPTAGLVVLDFAFDTWGQLRAHTGRLERFVTPKWIETATN